MKTLGLYIHVPFCLKKCNYCDFFSNNYNQNTADEYTDAVLRNIKFWSNKYKDRIIDTIYLGGGTPSVVGTEKICKMLSAATDNFILSPETEITIEVNPITNLNVDFRVLNKFGINRVSVGMQSTNNDELKLLGRLHNTEDVKHTVESIKSADINNFSLDVMLGIPLQNAETLDKTLNFCIESEADHISTYMLKIEKGTPFYLNKDNLVFADDDRQADFYEQTSNKLIASGYRHYEISNFCKDDKLSRHNMKYWLLDDYLGIGPSAHSMIDNQRFYYPRSFDAFYNNCIEFESESKTAEEYIMLSLRTDSGLNLKKYTELFKQGNSADLLAEAEKLEKLGYLTIDNGIITLNQKGYLVSNAIISALLSKGNV